MNPLASLISTGNFQIIFNELCHLTVNCDIMPLKEGDIKMNDKNIRSKCKTETIRRKLYRRINWIKNNPRKEKFYGFATEELYPVYITGHEYLLFKSNYGKTYTVELLQEFELPVLFFTAEDIKKMRFDI